MKTLLAIGDKEDRDSYQKFFRQRKFFKKHGFLFKTTDYDSVLEGKLPKIRTEKLIIFFFFPFGYWKKSIEPRTYNGIYGNRSFYIKFKKIWRIINKKINVFYSDKEIYFINEPSKISVDRDKELTKNILAKNDIEVPKAYFTRNSKNILKLLDKGKKLYVKVRYGSMGKGITYLEKDRWFTNFRFKDGKIIGRKSDKGWTFKEITDNKKFLKKLLKQDIIIEEAINPLLLKGRKFDLRLYVCFGKVLYIYPRSNGAEEITTNISQGAKGENSEFLHGVPDKLVEMAARDACKATKAMQLNFTGVDIMPNGNCEEVSVIEVNTFPGFPKVRKFNLAEYMIKEIVKQEWK